MGLALHAAHQYDLPSPLGWAAKSVYESVCAEGDGEMATKDFRLVHFAGPLNMVLMGQCGTRVVKEEAGRRSREGMEGWRTWTMSRMKQEECVSELQHESLCRS